MSDFTRCDMCRARLRSFSSSNGQDSVTWLLPCLHALCSACKAKCSRVSFNQQRILCQICDTDCPKNHVLALPDSRDCVVRRCESAACPEKQQATMKCTNCNESLCAICSQAHRRVTATSAHILQAIDSVIPEHARCTVHTQMRVVLFCSCGVGLCNECVMSHSHEGPAHVTTPFDQMAPSCHVEEVKITSSTAREATHIDCSLSVIQVRKTTLEECVNILKKEVGNHVVQICQSVMRRGNDLLRSLDTVQRTKTLEYDKLREELNWQRMRFDRINSYVEQIKNYEDSTALVITKQFLENCIRVIKTKKVNSERSLNGLQRPPVVQFKPNTEEIVEAIDRWGRILADIHEGGSVKAVEVPPTPPTSNLLDVSLFDLSRNGTRPPCSYASVPSTSFHQPQRPIMSVVPGAMRAGAPPLRPPISHEQAYLIQQQQQQLRAAQTAQEMAMRQVAHTVRKPNPADPRYQMFAAQMRAPNIPSSLPSRFAAPSCSYPIPVSASMDPHLSNPRFMMPNGQLFSYPTPRMVSPGIRSPIPATNLMEALNGLQRMQTVNSSQKVTSAPSIPQTASTATQKNLSQEEERKKIINQEMEEARRRREASQLNERPSSFEASGAAQPVAECSSQPVAVSSPVNKSPDQPSSAQNTATITGSPPPKDPEPAAANRTPLKVTIRRNTLNGATSALVSDPEQNSNTDGTNENSDESKWDDYCYVCQQGCDEKTGSLGCCARCPHVYHNYCHIPAIKQQMETLPDEWACTLCLPAEPLLEDTGVMGQRERLLCSKVLLKCYQNFLHAEPFSHPVPRTVPNYYVIIKQPMDFGTVARRLKERTKDAFTNVSQFIFCMNLVFENCSTFNPPDDEVAKAGRSVYQFYSQAVKEYLPCMKNHVWLYINKYSEGRNNMIVQKDSSSQVASVPKSRETNSAEPVSKRPRREIKSEFEA